MFVKMGYKIMTMGTERALRIYTPSIRFLATILDVPSSNHSWNSLNEFLTAVSSLGSVDQPYTRNLLAKQGQNSLPVHLSINKHGTTSQGYIIAPRDTWLNEFVGRYLNQDYNFEYLVGPNRDVLLIPQPPVDLIEERKKDETLIQNEVSRFCKRNRLPPNAAEIGLYFELEELEYLKRKGCKPSHRYPRLDTKISSLRGDNITCDIDVLDSERNFIKYVEVKSVSGAPENPFNLTINEWRSREWCNTNGYKYEIVVYYHTGRMILERIVIPETAHLDTRPSGYWCSFS